MSKTIKAIIRMSIIILIVILLAMLIVAVVQSYTDPTFGTDRFIEVSSEMNIYSGAKIIVDQETGIQYLWVVRGHQGGLTPLLGSDGGVTYYSGDGR